MKIPCYSDVGYFRADYEVKLYISATAEQHQYGLVRQVIHQALQFGVKPTLLITSYSTNLYKFKLYYLIKALLQV